MKVSYDRFLGVLFLLVFILIIAIHVFSGNSEKSKVEDSKQDTVHVHARFGIPMMSDTIQSFMIDRDEYFVSYNFKKGIANWVSWELHSGWIGGVERMQGKFLTDTMVPKEYRITHDHYTHSGYDRGHIVRSKERTNTEEANRATFLMTNIFPQTPDLNRGVWLDFEYFCENLANDGYLLSIVSGAIFRDSIRYIGGGKVAVPDSCFKVVLAINASGKGKMLSADTVGIAVVMPNVSGIRSDKWRKYQRTIRQVEHSTGFDFFWKLDDDTEERVENDGIK